MRAFALTFAALGFCGGAVWAASGEPELVARLSPTQRYYYEGDAIDLRLIVSNPGTTAARMPTRRSVAAGLEIRAEDGSAVAAGAARDRETGAAAREIPPGGAIELGVDLAPVAGLRSAGRFELRWAADRLAAPPVQIVVLPRFEEAGRYVAVLETDVGTFAFRLLDAVSPVAVRAFVDLARAGYYDGSPFHEARADSHVGAGRPRRAGAADAPFLFPAEQSDVIVVPGTVVIKPVGPAPPANGPEFLIALRPQPGWTGQVTILGQVHEGLDVVQRIAGGAPTEVRIRRVRIVREDETGGS